MNWEPAPNADEFQGCIGCGHFRRGQRPGCLAYPGGIPLAILSGAVDHMVPRPGQRGETVFEPVDFEVWHRTGERVPASKSHALG